MTSPLPSLSRLAKAALEYARRGWWIFPLEDRGKRPRIDQGFRAASNDLSLVKEWWQRWPEANIGCWPGKSGFVVVDVDGPEGEVSAQRLGLLAEPTLEVQTGREGGGRHRWYRHPGPHIGNAVLADHLDLRGDAGYVVLPPSVHPSGRLYRWEGKLSEVAPLPPVVLQQLAMTPETSGETGDKLPAWMLPYLDAAPGKRNATMARFVGWAFTKWPDTPSVLAMALGLNAAWTAPLPRDEVEATVKSIGAREAQKPKRTTTTGQTLKLEDKPPEERKSFNAIAYDQIEGAIARGRRDHTAAPRWRWRDLDRLMGPMLPGDLNIVGALTGNGKTSFLLSQMDRWVKEQVPVLYVPLELDPEDLRRQWAAWTLGQDWPSVARNDWSTLGPQARDQHEAELIRQAKSPFVHFPPDRRISLAGLASYVAQAVEEIKARVVVVDHFHRMDFGPASQNYRVQVTESARQLKDLAREHGLVLVAAAQLNTDPSPLDRYYPPVLKRLKESAGLAEEANVVLMLSRRLRNAVSADELAGIKSGHTDIRALEEEALMVVTCRKSRLDDAPRDRAAFLEVHGGRVLDRSNFTQRHQEATP